jgi:hypothetical protein
MSRAELSVAAWQQCQMAAEYSERATVVFWLVFVLDLLQVMASRSGVAVVAAVEGGMHTIGLDAALALVAEGVVAVVALAIVAAAHPRLRVAIPAVDASDNRPWELLALASDVDGCSTVHLPTLVAARSAAVAAPSPVALVPADAPAHAFAAAPDAKANDFAPLLNAVAAIGPAEPADTADTLAAAGRMVALVPCPAQKQAASLLAEASHGVWPAPSDTRAALEEYRMTEC